MTTTWAKELPSKTGWYWMRSLVNKYEDAPEIVCVRDYVGELAVGNNRLNSWWKDKYEWAGPIDEPV